MPTFKEQLENVGKIALIVAIIVIGAFAINWTLTRAVALSDIAFAVFKTGVALGLWYLVDLLFLARMNTGTEIAKGNTSYGLMLIAVAIVIAGAFLSS